MPYLQFKGKSFVQNHHLAVPYHQLVPQKDKSLTDKVSLHDNLIIHGDNLVALKALLPTYSGKIKCIYIDPPYNTGKEGWVYSDNVSSPIIREWLKDKKPVDKEDLTRHDKWLTMMLPRIKLLKELMTEDAVLMISIDENEAGNLRCTLEEVFGDENVEGVVWKKIDPKFDKNTNAKVINRTKRVHEYILIAYKNKARTYFSKLKKLPDWLNKQSNPDNDPRGSYKQGIISFKEGHLNENKESEYYYAITAPSGRKITRHFFVTKKEFDELVSDKRIYFPKNGDGVPALKIFENEEKDFYFDTILDGLGSLSSAKSELKEIFPELDEEQFDTPKPSKLIKELIRSVSSESDIILDSFSGSGTTAQSVLELNKESGSSRKFILIEMEDYANEITAERVRRVIKGVPTSTNNLVKTGLGGTFSYFVLGDAIETEGILKGTNLPSYLELARYVYYTATGEEFDESKLDESKNFVGSSSHYDVYMLYKPEVEYLKQTALTLNLARELREKAGNRQILVFAPTKYVETGELDELKIDFCQLPFEIYRVSK